MGMDQLDDLEIAALLSSKICHDVIGPVGAIYNGLEVLDEEGNDENSKAYALDVIRSEAGKHFDAVLVEAFLKCHRQFDEVRARYDDSVEAPVTISS